MIVIIGFITIK